jgi:sugar O-acyltransferase (sialic acid O-acetyltransferase NeuD family)
MAGDIFIVGAGTYGAVIADLAEACGYSVAGFYDDDLSKAGKSVLGKPVLGKLDPGKDIRKKAHYVVAIGNVEVHLSKSREIMRKGGSIPNLIHPKAEISKYAHIGKACIIHAFTYIWTEARVSDFSVISPNVVIAHHATVGEGSFISTGCSIGAGINIAEKVLVGIGSTVMTGVKKIGRNTIIGAGSVVIKDVEAESVVAGVPAKFIKKNERPKK